MSSYVPNKLINDFHNVPRYGLDFEGVSNVFNININGVGRDYFEGVLFQAGGIVAFTCLLFLLYSITFIVGCCRCRASPPKRCCSICGKVGYIFSTLLLAGGLGASMWYTEDFHNGLLTLLDGLRNFYSLFVTVSFTVSNPLLQNLTVFSSSSSSLQTLGTGTPFQAQTEALALASNSALSFAVSIGQLLNSTTDALVSDFTFTDNGIISPTSKVNLNTATDALPRSSYILMGVVLGWLVIQMVLLIGNKCISRIFKACSCLTIASAVLVGLLTAVFYVPALFGSDICVAPDTTITNIFNASSGTGSGSTTFGIADTWYYYSQCGTNPSLAPVGVYANLLNATQQLTDAYTLVQAINGSVYGNPTYDPWLPYIGNISDSVVSANITLNNLLKDTACLPVNSIYTDIVNGLCNGAILGFITAFLASIASLGAFVLLLSFTACLIFHHPGDAGSGDDNGPTRYDDLYEEVALNSSKKKNKVSKNTNYGTSSSKETVPTSSPATGRAARIGNMTGGNAAVYGSSEKNWR